jgi:hypothetical protein
MPVLLLLLAQDSASAKWHQHRVIKQSQQRKATATEV